ncbi:MAG: serine/threonine-protein kinase [Candidatus Geothermincolales bacterium]
MASRYRVIRELGRGAMGRVFLAYDQLLDREVAIKELVLPAHLEGEEREEAKNRFRREAQAAARLSHPHILTVHDFLWGPNKAFIVMEYLEGKTLRDILEERLLSPAELLGLAPMVCDALDYAHSRGVIHRDIKPDNIFVLENGSIKVADFGIAKIIHSPGTLTRESILGTPNYIAPEMIAGEGYDHRVDVFSWGAAMYELLTGTRPFDADGDYAILYRIVNERERPLRELRDDVPEDLARLIHRALEKDPDRRFQSMREMREEFLRIRARLGMKGEEETFDRDTARQRDLEEAGRLEEFSPVEYESDGAFLIHRDREWMSLIARIYSEKERSRQEVDAPAEDGSPAGVAAPGRKVGHPATRDPRPLYPTGSEARPRVPPGAVHRWESPAQARVPLRELKERDRKEAVLWAVAALAGCMVGISSYGLPWANGSLILPKGVSGFQLVEGTALTVLLGLALLLEGVFLLGWRKDFLLNLGEVLSLLSVFCLLAFVGLRLVGGVGVEKAQALDAWKYLSGVGIGFWLGSAGSLAAVAFGGRARATWPG